jgi:uncharacterized protein YcbK (DUF882 family)
MNRSWTRRRWLRTLLASGAGLSFARLSSGQQVETAPAQAPLPERTIELLNTHTNESLRVVFKRGGEYDPAGLAALDKLLRDHRNGQVTSMDPRLFDQLADLADAAQRPPSYEVISGYRSPESNAKMSTPGSGVAKKSLHMAGRAIDVRLRNCPCEDLRDLAIAAAKGGVGYYKRSDFVHIDTGSFRTWVG